MARTVVLAFLVCAIAITATARFELDFQDCGSPAVKLISVVVEKEPFDSRRTIVLNVTGLATQDVSGGTFSFTVTRKFFGRQIPFYTETGKICEFMGEPEDCTFKKETVVSMEYEQEIPRFAPKGIYNILVRALGPDRKPLACITLEYHLNHTVLVLPV